VKKLEITGDNGEPITSSVCSLKRLLSVRRSGYVRRASAYPQNVDFRDSWSL
jgi:hypothetical protein